MTPSAGSTNSANSWFSNACEFVKKDNYYTTTGACAAVVFGLVYHSYQYAKKVLTNTTTYEVFDKKSNESLTWTYKNAQNKYYQVNVLGKDQPVVVKLAFNGQKGELTLDAKEGQRVLDLLNKMKGSNYINSKCPPISPIPPLGPFVTPFDTPAEKTRILNENFRNVSKYKKRLMEYENCLSKCTAAQEKAKNTPNARNELCALLDALFLAHNQMK